MLKEKLSYSQRLIAENAEQHPTYFLCGSNSVHRLMAQAQSEADQLVKELRAFFPDEIDIVIGSTQHLLGWSVTAALFYNGKEIRREDPCELLFLELNMLMMKTMLKSGMVSFGKNSAGDAKEVI